MVKTHGLSKICLFVLTICLIVLYISGCSELINFVTPDVSVSLTLSGDSGGEPYIQQVSFSRDKLTADIDVALSAVTIELAAQASGASVTIDGQPLAAGSPVTVSLEYGLNQIRVVVTPDSGNPLTYILNISRSQPLLSDNADLAGIELSAGTLSPAFDPAETSYATSVSNDTASADITATLDDSIATLEINGTAATSGTARSIALVTGGNVVSIEVTAEDGTTVKTYTVIIMRLAGADTTPPVITLLGDETMIVAYGSTFADPGATVTDNLDAARTISSEDTVDTSTAGDYTLRYNAVDVSGNPAAEVTRTVTVLENIEIAGTLYLYTEHPLILDYAQIVITTSSFIINKQNGETVIDGILFEYSNETNYMIHGNGTNFFQRAEWLEAQPGELTVTSFSGNPDIDSARTESDVAVVETWYTDTALTVPVLRLQGDAAVTIVAGESYNDPGALVKDWGITTDVYADVDLDGLSTTSAAVGEYTLTYSYTDGDGNSAETVLREVTVLAEPDTTPPVITLTGDSTIYLEYPATYIEPGFSAVDDTDEDITADVVVSGTVDTAILGTYTLEYDVDDSSENSADTVSRTVIVRDTTPPVIVLNGDNPIEVAYNGTYTDPGAVVTDNYDAEVNITGAGSVDTSTPGDYTITYNATDSLGNPAVEVTRTVTVLPQEPFELSDMYLFWSDEWTTGYMYQQTATDSTYITYLNGGGTVDNGEIVEWDNDLNTALVRSDAEATPYYYNISWDEPVANTTEVRYSVACTTLEEARGAATDDLAIVCYTAATAVPPVVVLNGPDPMTTLVGVEFSDPGAVVYDWGSDDAAIGATDLDGLDPVNPAAETYTLEYTSSQDTDGNQTTATRTVEVVAAESCEIATLYVFEPNDNQDWLLLEISGTGWTVVDTPGGEPFVSGTVIEFDNTLNRLIIPDDTGDTGAYAKFAWTEPDPEGFTVLTQYFGYPTIEDARTATVGDNELEGYTIEANVPPVLILNGDDPVMVELDGTFIDEGVSVKDWDDAEPTDVMGDDSGVDTSTNGTYTVNYSYGPDSDGNFATPITRTVGVGSGIADIIIQ